MRGESGGVVLGGACGEAAYQKYTAQEGGAESGGGEQVTYVVSFHRVLKTSRYPVTGCPEVAHSAGQMREHFMYRHLFSWIAVVQEGRETLPRCDLCGMHIPEGRLRKHQQTQRCDRNTQMQCRRRDVVIVSRCAEASFSLAGEDHAEQIDGMDTFKYLGRILDRSDNY